MSFFEKKKLKQFLTESNLLKVNVISSVIIITFLVISLGSFFIYSQYSNYKKSLKYNRDNIIKDRKDDIRNRVEQLVSVIDTYYQNNQRFLHRVLKEHVFMAEDVATDLYEWYKNQLNNEELKGLIVNTLGEIRFAVGNSYIYINDLDGVSILQPAFPEFEGVNLLSLNKDHFFKSIVEKDIKFLKSNEQGFVIYKKYVGFVKKIPIFNWYIGSFVDMDIIEGTLKKDILEMLRQRVADDRYMLTLFEVNNLEGGKNFAKILIRQSNPKEEGKFISDNATDIRGIEYRKKYLKSIREKGSSFISFELPDKNVKRKDILAYLYYYPRFNWLISINVSMDDIEKMYKSVITNVKKDLFVQLLITILLFVLFASVAFVISLFFSKLIWRIFQNYRNQIEDKTKSLISAQNELRRRLYYNLDTNLPSFEKFREDLNYINMNNRCFAAGIIYLENYNLLKNYYGLEIGKDIFKMLADEVVAFFGKSEFNIYHYSEDTLALLATYESNIDKKYLQEVAERFVNYVNNKRYILPEHKFAIDFVVYTVFVYNTPIAMEALGFGIEEAKRNKIYSMVYDNYESTKNYFQNTIIWSRKVKEALDEYRIIPFYQPIYDRNNNIISYESLVRLIDNNGDIISPALFLDITRRSNLYSQITKRMFDESFKCFKDSGINFSVNVNIEDFYNNETFNYIKEVLNNNKEVAKRFTFEIVESENINDYDLFGKYIRSLKESYNVKFAIDDFGSGYSNFSHILSLDIDYLKVDGTLIKNLDRDKDMEILVSSIIYFAKQLNLKTIAEFVHSEEILKKTYELGFDYFQGFYLGAPKRDIF
ncbi:MAG: EAL domain-containing protein [Deferribacterota bacterium]|nr:EAL domain-containing protein [Deferribacterota bacterium]